MRSVLLTVLATVIGACERFFNGARIAERAVHGCQRFAGNRAMSRRVAIIIDQCGCDDRHGDQRLSLLPDGQGRRL